MRSRRLVRLLLVGATVIGAGLTSPASSLATSHDTADAATEAQRLRAEAERLTGDARAQQKLLERVTAKANKALGAYQEALDARSAALSRSIEAEQSMAESAAKADDAREALNAFLIASYQSGGTNGLGATMSVLQSGSATEALDQLTFLAKVNEHQTTVVADMEAAGRAREAAAAAAEKASDKATAEEGKARDAKAEADALIAEQVRQLTVIEAARTAALSAAQRLDEEAARIELARQAEQRARQIAGRGSPECPGESLDGFANGFLPVSALCPLWGTRGHELRADAAAGYNELSKAYAAVFGAPMCITDSYRPYAVQVDVKRRKPTLAATPGTSNHGWGRAVDLCGGIQTDGTASNTWLRLNALRFGWFHPGWADRGGNGPYEPWHWEYAG